MVSSRVNFFLLLDYQVNILLLHFNSSCHFLKIPIYHEIQDATEEEQQLHKGSKVPKMTTSDSFYDLLQAVH